jgi:1-acyl-sn-glycerol-3-phosphate acyltransferase
MQTVRSLFFTAFLMLSACVWGFTMALFFFLPDRIQFAMARSWARCVLWMLERVCGLSYRVEGREHIPAGTHIVMSKHTSAWETIAFFVIFPPHVWVLKHELLWIPFMGWGLKRLRPIAIDRGAGHRAVNQVIEQGKERLAEGLWVVIFPEGTRVPRGEIRKYGVSGALLATATGSLVVPVSHDAGTFWPRRGIVKKPGTIRMIIGEPVSAAGKNARDLNEEIRGVIESGLARIESEAAAGTG